MFAIAGLCITHRNIGGTNNNVVLKVNSCYSRCRDIRFLLNIEIVKNCCQPRVKKLRNKVVLLGSLVIKTSGMEVPGPVTSWSLRIMCT